MYYSQIAAKNLPVFDDLDFTPLNEVPINPPSLYQIIEPSCLFI